MGVVTLLRRPEMAWSLGRRGHARLARIFDEAACLSGYRELLGSLRRPRARPRPTPAAASRSRHERHPDLRRRPRAASSTPPRPRAPGHARGRRRARGVGGHARRRGAAQRADDHGRRPRPSRATASAACPARVARRASSSRRCRSSSPWWRSRPGPAPLSERVGSDAVANALIWALPMTLALQWGLASRYLSRPQGLAAWARRPLLLLLAAAALVAVPTLLMGRSGAVAGLLTLTWTGGTIVIRRRWSLAYAGMVVAGERRDGGRDAGDQRLGFTAALTTVLSRSPSARGSCRTGPPARRWGRAALAAAIGTGVGVVLVTDRSVDWSVGSYRRSACCRRAWPASGPAPTCGASSRSSRRRCRASASSTRAYAASATRPLRVLVGAVARLVAGTAALSLLLVGIASSLDLETSGNTVLAGFGLVALATLFVGLLEAVGRGAWALGARRPRHRRRDRRAAAHRARLGRRRRADRRRVDRRDRLASDRRRGPQPSRRSRWPPPWGSGEGRSPSAGDPRGWQRPCRGPWRRAPSP